MGSTTTLLGRVLAHVIHVEANAQSSLALQLRVGGCEAQTTSKQRAKSSPPRARSATSPEDTSTTTAAVKKRCVFNEFFQFSVQVRDVKGDFDKGLCVTLLSGSSGTRLGADVYIPFLHQQANAVADTEVDVPLAGLGTRHSVRIRIQLQWVPRPGPEAAAALRDVLALHFYQQQQATQDRAVSAYTDPLRPLAMGAANERFMRCSLPIFRFQDNVEKLFLWVRWERSCLALALWVVVCAFLDYLPVLLPLVVVALLRFAPPSHTSTASGSGSGSAGAARATSTTPFSARPFSVAEKGEALRRIQNFMEMFSDIVDGVHAAWLRVTDPAALRRLTAISCVATVMGLAALFTASSWTPLLMSLAPRLLRLTLTAAGVIPLLLGNPAVRAGLQLVRFDASQAQAGLRRHSASHIDGSAANAEGAGAMVKTGKTTPGIHAASAERKEWVTVFEQQRWWLGRGWAGESHIPRPKEEVACPPGRKWSGLWELTPTADLGGVNRGCWRFSRGFPYSDRFHDDKRPGDFVRRRRWRRAVVMGAEPTSGDDCGAGRHTRATTPRQSLANGGGEAKASPVVGRRRSRSRSNSSSSKKGQGGDAGGGDEAAVVTPPFFESKKGR